MLLSESYRDLNHRMHLSHADYGISGHKWATQIFKVIEDDGGYSTILDYGAGKGTLATALAEKGITIAEYDPAIPCKNVPPEPAELVICGDVLEHIEHECLDAVLADLKRLAQRKLIVIIDMLPSDKWLPDGRNTHLITEDAKWWGAKLSKTFDVLEWYIAGRKLYAELAPKLPGAIPTKRRTPPAQWDEQIAAAKREFNRYSDAFSRIETVNMWDGVDDEVADMQVVVKIVERMADVAAALHNIACLTSKAVFFVINLKVRPDARYWRQMIEQRFRIYNFMIVGDVLNVIGGPKLSFHGLKAVGVVAAEKRWEQTEAAMARYSKRAPVAPAHDRLAVLACYGPSLVDTIDDLRVEALAPDADVISVSGAHDLLIERGIAPDFHVECDPRAHKADNIAQYHEGTRYLLASCVHPVLFDKLGPDADISLWHTASAQHSAHLIDELGENPGNVITGGGSVGLRSLSLLYAMGYRRFSIHGMDCSFAYAGKQQHAGKHAGERQDVIAYSHSGRVFATSYILQSYATDFMEMIQRVNDLDVRLNGDGLLQAMVASMGNHEEHGQH